MQSLAGKIAVVTGAAGNLGRAVAQAFAAHGAGVALVDRDAAALAAAQSELPAGSAVATFAADLLKPDAVAELAGRIVEHFGRVDVLANIAGGFTMGPPLHETSDHVWDFMLDINARSVFHSCRALIPTLLQHPGGRIINVSARAALEGKAHMIPYCASKAAVITLTEGLAAELKEAGVNVNCVLPGTLDTPQNRAAMPDQDFSRWVPPAALADVILFLATDASRCVTGAAIPVYGRS
jgi:NAD(P)-dependent dehydrogenase (short-subunit alcohol dehydrogenase family)